MACKINRIYNNLDERGIRVLVDRVWPRGISKDKANLDHWLKDIAPSSELRKWFNHEPSKFEAFKEKYKQELESGDQQEALNKLKEIYKENKQTLIILYGAKDEKHNQAIVLKEIVDG